MPLPFGKLVLCLLVAGTIAALIAVLLYPPLNPLALFSMLDWNLIAAAEPLVRQCGSLPLLDKFPSLGWNTVLFCATLPSTDEPLRTDSFVAHTRDTILANLGSVEPNWRWKVSSETRRLARSPTTGNEFCQPGWQARSIRSVCKRLPGAIRGSSASISCCPDISKSPTGGHAKH